MNIFLSFQQFLSFWMHFVCLEYPFGEGNGNPLQSSCLENPRDGGARWAAIYGVAQSQTRLKRLSSSSLRLTGLISLLSKGRSGVFSSPTIQRFFKPPTQGSNPGLLHCRWILYHLSHQGSLGKPYIPIITDWIIRRTCTVEHLVI